MIYDPLIISLADLKRKIRDTYQNLDQAELPDPRTIEIPVVYGGDRGPDLESVAQYHRLTPQAVIDYHTRPTYRVYMIGFTPGYPYLGEVPDAIATPRRETPRILVPRGSVGIAQKQTGIYSVDSPGGWQIIGWTPVNLFDPQGQPPSLLMMGDRVRFKAISRGGSIPMAAIETLEIISPGIMTSVQDLGRYGYGRFGVAPSGALDSFSLRIANLLVGNSEDQACLETMLSGSRHQGFNRCGYGCNGW